MNRFQPHPDSVADEQAALWAARLDGDTLDTARRAELETWLAQKPAHRVLLTRYCQFSADLEVDVPALVATGAATMPVTQPTSARRWRFPGRTVATLAAAAAIAVSVAVLRPASRVENFVMASAERGARTLADGSRVELNANTTLRFKHTPTERRVRLTGGEALFMVAKDPARPFFVETAAGSVRVTGTTFNVRTDSSASTFEVTVIEGSVEAQATGPNGAATAAPRALTAGDQFSSRRGTTSLQTLSASKLDDALAWRVGTIIFHNTPLAEALARYALYHGRTIEVAPAVAQKSVGGRYGIDDLSGFLDGIASTQPVNVTYAPNGTVIVNAQP